MNSLDKLHQHPKRQNLLLDLKTQLAKDLGLPAKDIPETNLYPFVKDWLEKRLLQGDQGLQHILYRVDIPQQVWESADKLAQAILEREAQKVFFRAQYSGKI